jgi:hypothetical protein
MHSGAVDQTRFDLLNQAAQQRLRARVADAGGNIAAVADEIRAQLNELDQEIARDPESGGGRQADRAFFVAQLMFLDMLAQIEAQSKQPQRERGWLSRLRAAFGRAQTAE